MTSNPGTEFSVIDQVLLSCSDGHALFDGNGKLLSWSVRFGEFYPKLHSKIKPGYAYADLVRDLISHKAIRNIKPIDDLDGWIDEHLSTLFEPDGEFIHHLEDGRYLSIKPARLDNGHWFFAAFDITVSVLQRESIRANKRKFENYAKISSDWFWELDSKLCYIYFSTHNTPLGKLGKRNLIGESRIAHVLESAVDNAQLHEHNSALEQQREVDVVLTWRDADHGDNLTHVQIIASPQYNEKKKFIGYLGCAKNVTAEFGLKKQLEYHATHDELTGLTNRRAFSEYVNDILKKQFFDKDSADDKTAEMTGYQTLVFIDLDQFKMINDSAGHMAGDRLLVDVAEVFRKIYGNSDDIISRLGGDEFAILSPSDKYQAKRQAEELIKYIGEYRFQWGERGFSIGASAGIVTLDETIIDESVLLSKADAACYSAKMSGRNQAHFYNRDSIFEANQSDELGKLELINESLLHNRLSLFLQPITPTRPSDEPVKFEVLLRLWDEAGNMVSPGDVIPIAEKYDRMQHLDAWVVENSIQSLQAFHDLGQRVALSVNLSGNTLSNESCMDRIAELVESYNVEPGALCFEVTETAAIKVIEKACRFITRLKSLGCQFSLDDFGSGLSSFSYLRTLQVDYLKIDGCFVTNIIEEKTTRAIVASFNTLAQELGMKTVAEYVENEQIAALLTDLNIDYLQGYAVGKPQCLDDWLSFYTEAMVSTGT